MTELSKSKFANASDTGEIPSFNGSEKAKATDFANYFCSYAELHHQKQMLADHNRMAAYHSSIIGNASVFKDKIVMDVGTGSGILAAWAAQAGARRVYAGKLSISHCAFPYYFSPSLMSFVPPYNLNGIGYCSRIHRYGTSRTECYGSE